MSTVDSSASTSTSSPEATPATSVTSAPDGDVETIKEAKTTPPSVKTPYKAKEALDDIPGVAYALETFLQSRMVECEDYCHESDPKKCVIRDSTLQSCTQPCAQRTLILCDRIRSNTMRQGFDVV